MYGTTYFDENFLGKSRNMGNTQYDFSKREFLPEGSRK
eukprot:COSAG06_NODE_49944_length_322_cov_0.582960_1_plen_37_part_10